MAKLDLDPISVYIIVQQLSAGVIQGLPQVDQLHEPTADHAADENARMNCVFACNAAISKKVGGHPEANGDAIKDGCANYGQNYTGGAAEETVEADGCLDHKWGIHADTFHAGNRTALLDECKRQSDAGNFTIVTIPSMWGSQPSQPGYNPDSPNFWTHACVYCGYEGDTHYLMNPWGGFIMSYSSADMALRLCFLKVYPVRKAGVIPVSNVPSGWSDDGTALHNHENSFVVIGGFREYVLAYAGGWHADNIPLENEHQVPETEWHAQLGQGVKQIFLLTILRDNPARENKVMETDAGAEVFALEAQVSGLTATVRTDQALINTMQAQLDAEKKQHGAADDLVKALKAALAS